MVTITPLSGAGAARAYQESSDNYYRQRLRCLGRWGAQEFGLAGEKMDFDAFQKILEGKDPHSGEQIIKQGPGESRPGIDFTLSPDKSFSLVLLLKLRLGWRRFMARQPKN